MHTLRHSHQLDSRELIAIAQANKKCEPYYFDGLAYSLADWEQKQNRVIVTLIPYAANHRTPKNRSRHSEQP